MPLIDPSRRYIERRKCERYPMLIQGIAEQPNLTGAGPFRVVASNISMGGMVFHAGDRADILGPDDVLTLRFGGLVDDLPIELTVRVVWKRKNTNTLVGTWAVGALFWAATEHQIRRLHDPAMTAHLSEWLWSESEEDEPAGPHTPTKRGSGPNISH